MARYTPIGTVSTVSQINTELEKIAEAISDTLSREGDTPNQMEDTLDMNSFPIINAKTDPNNPNSLITVGQSQADDNVVLAAAKAYTDAVAFGDYGPSEGNTEYTTQDLISLGTESVVGDVLVTSGYAKAGDGGGAAWELTSDTGTSSQSPNTSGELYDANGRRWVYTSDNVNVKAFGALTDGSDATDAINTAIRFWDTKLVLEDGPDYTTSTLVVPPGKYDVTRINMTQLVNARNKHILAWGAVWNATEAGVDVVDAINSRWLHVHGLTVTSNNVLSRSGWKCAPNAEAVAVGNNQFHFCTFIGQYERAPFANYGAETTAFYNCWFSNSYIDSECYSFIGDGAGYFTYDSDFVTITRPFPDLVSFTNNRFYSCQFRTVDTVGAVSGGIPVFLASFTDWSFDGGCYFATFDQCAIELYSTGSFRSKGLYVEGLFENGTGVDNIIRFVGDGTDTVLVGFEVKTPTPHATSNWFQVGTGGNVRLERVKIEINTKAFGNPSFFSGNLSISGTIKTQYDEGLNLGDLNSFNGDIAVESIDDVASWPVSGNYEVRDKQGRTITTGIVYDSYLGWDNVTPDANGFITVRRKMNAINLDGVTQINRILSGFYGVTDILLRNPNGQVITLKDSNDLRLGGVDIELNQNTCVHLVRVSGDIWQIVASGLAGEATVPEPSETWSLSSPTYNTSGYATVGAGSLDTSTMFFLSNDPSNISVVRYSKSTGVFDGYRKTLSGLSLVYNMFLESNTSRWVAHFGGITEFDNNWNPTGNTAPITPRDGFVKLGSSYYALNASTITEYDETFTSTGNTISLPNSDYEDMARAGVRGYLYMLRSNGEVYRVRPDGTGYELVLSTGISGARGIDILGGDKMVVCSLTTAQSYTLDT